MNLHETTIYVIHSGYLANAGDSNVSHHTHLETLNIAEAQVMEVDLYRKRGITSMLESFIYQPKFHCKKRKS